MPRQEIIEVEDVSSAAPSIQVLLLRLSTNSGSVTNVWMLQNSGEAAKDTRGLKRKIEVLRKEEDKRIMALNYERLFCRGVQSKLKIAPQDIQEAILENWLQSKRHIAQHAHLLARCFCAKDNAVKKECEVLDKIMEGVERDYNSRYVNINRHAQTAEVGPGSTAELFKFVREELKTRVMVNEREAAQRKMEIDVSEYLTIMFEDGIAGGKSAM